MNILIPPQVMTALNLLNDAGYEAYIVGGCVRDMLMGRMPADWDITTSALPEQTARVFKDYTAVNTGLRFGTLTIVINGMPLEITTYRVDGAYEDGRRPETVSFTPSLTEDLRRRDFTINAIAYHPLSGFVDPFDGRSAILRREIACVGNPTERLSEDSLRIARAVRFAATLGFTVVPDTAAALHALSPSVCHSSVERIATEFKKTICGEYIDYAFEHFRDILTAMLPELADILVRAQDLQNLSPVPVLRFAFLFCGMAASDEMVAQTASSALKRLRMDNATIHSVHKLLMHRSCLLEPTERCLLYLLNRLETDLIYNHVRIQSVLHPEYDTVAILELLDKLIESGACYRIQDLCIDGEDLIALGFFPGPIIGDTLRQLLMMVMDGLCTNDRASLLQAAIKYK